MEIYFFHIFELRTLLINFLHDHSLLWDYIFVSHYGVQRYSRIQELPI